MNPTSETIPEKDASAARLAPPAGDDLPVTLIERSQGWRLIGVRELWRYRELLYFLIWRDVKVRYKQTALGVAWAILQPFAFMIIMSLFFGRLAELPPEGTRLGYPLFVFIGLLPWFFFANAVNSAAQSVVGNQNLVTKVYFPRLIIPLAAVATALVDFAITFGMLLIMLLCFSVWPDWEFLLLPLLMLGLVIAATGVGTFLAALTVAYRDFRYVIPFMLQLWMLATPTIYMQVLGDYNPRWGTVLPLNPAYGLIANFRNAVLGRPMDVYSLSVSLAVSLAVLLAGCLYFRRVERHFADII